MTTFEKKNPIIEGIQYTGKNKKDVLKFVKASDFEVTSYMGVLFLHESKNMGKIAHTVKLTDWVTKDQDGNLSVVENNKMDRDYRRKE